MISNSLKEVKVYKKSIGIQSVPAYRALFHRSMNGYKLLFLYRNILRVIRGRHKTLGYHILSIAALEYLLGSDPGSLQTNTHKL